MCVPDELPAVAVDVVMLEHVLVNLVENAAEHTPPGGVVRLEASHGERVLAFRVIDHGPGIAPEDREIVFDEFVRLDAQDRRGMGLGLAIVRVLVDAHEGKVSCEETPGGGATFVVELPMADFADLAE